MNQAKLQLLKSYWQQKLSKVLTQKGDKEMIKIAKSCF
jgi:hypothetical protein